MKDKIMTVLCFLTGLMMINAGLNKLFHYMPMPEMSAEQQAVMANMAGIKWLLPLVAVVEIVGGLLLMLPKTRLIGAVCLLPIFVGIIVHNAVYAPANLGITFVLFAVTVWVMVADRERLLGLLR